MLASSIWSLWINLKSLLKSKDVLYQVSSDLDEVNWFYSSFSEAGKEKPQLPFKNSKKPAFYKVKMAVKVRNVWYCGNDKFQYNKTNCVKWCFMYKTGHVRESQYYNVTSIYLLDSAVEHRVKSYDHGKTSNVEKLKENKNVLTLSWSTKWGVFQEIWNLSISNNFDCMFLSCHVRVSEWIHTL